MPYVDGPRSYLPAAVIIDGLPLHQLTQQRSRAHAMPHKKDPPPLACLIALYFQPTNSRSAESKVDEDKRPHTTPSPTTPFADQKLNSVRGGGKPHVIFP
jgi:hypothetical protein